MPDIHHGSVLEGIIAVRHADKPGTRITAGLLLAKVHRNSDGSYLGGFACEYAGNGSVEEAEANLREAMQQLFQECANLTSRAVMRSRMITICEASLKFWRPTMKAKMRGFRLPAVLLVTLLLAGTAFAGPTQELFTFNGSGDNYIGVSTYSLTAAGSPNHQYSHPWLLSDDYADRIVSGGNWPASSSDTANYAIWALFAPSTTSTPASRNVFSAAADAAEIFNYWTASGDAGLTTPENGQGSSSWQGSYAQLASPDVSTPIPGMAGAHREIGRSVINYAPQCKVPEPTSLTLMGTGLVALAAMLRRKLRPAR